MSHYFISEAEGVCGASVPGYVETQSGYVRLVMFGPVGFAVSVSGMTVIVMCCGAPPWSVDQSWLSCGVIQSITQVLSIAPGRSKLAWGCGLVSGLISHFIPATGWLVSRLAFESIFLGC